QFADAAGEVVFSLKERTQGREPKSFDREVVYVQEDLLRSPEAILELQEEPPGGRREAAVEVQVEEQVAASGPAEAEEGGIPLDPPAALIVHLLPHPADGRQEHAQKLKGNVVVLLGLGIV